MLAEILGVRKGVTAVIGSGGKTTLLRTLGEELARSGARVILATSTKFLPFPGIGTVPGGEREIAEVLGRAPLVCAAALRRSAAACTSADSHVHAGQPAPKAGVSAAAPVVVDHCVHVCRKLFNLNFNCFCCCTCMLFCISSYNGNRITKLEDFFIAEYRTFESVCLVVFWKHYKTIDLISSACCLNIFCCDNTDNTWHALCFCCVNAEDICMRNLCLCKSKAKCS